MIDNDGSLEDNAIWYALPLSEILWRETANHLNLLSSDYRYAEESDLPSPWTKDLLLAYRWVRTVTRQYAIWCSPLEIGSVWPLPDEMGVDQPAAERVYAAAHALFEKAGLLEYVSFVEKSQRFYRQAIHLMDANLKWEPFQIDLNSPSVFMLVDSADQWFYIVDQVIQERGVDSAKRFLQSMHMASLEYIYREIPGSHDDPHRVHEEGNPLGYGVSTEVPSFGYRREHRSEIVFAGWAAATMPHLDLFGSMFFTQEIL